MPGKWRTCGKKLPSSDITHCSNECLFSLIRNSKSISGTPIESWDDNPWI
jgi:hypothetical protein